MPAPPPFSWPADALPAVRVAGRFPLDQRGFRYVYRGPSHAVHVHLYEGKIRLGDETIDLRPGDMTITPANVPSAYDLPSPGHHFCMHFLPAGGNGIAHAIPVHAPLGALAEHAGEKILTIGRLLSAGGDLGAAAASAGALEFLLWLALQTRRRSPHDHAPTRGVLAARRVATILQTRFAEPLYVPDLADEMEMSQNPLARVFRNWYGMTIQRYLLARRIDTARHLLTTSSIPVHRVATRVGIDDRQYFNKQFRRVTGMSPSAYRARGMG